MIIVETTFNKKEDAESIVSFLLEEKLIACATYKNVESSYVWKGTIENEKEIEVSFQAVQKYEKGMCSPSPFNLHKMSIFLEVKLDDLLDPRFMDRLAQFKEEQAFREMDLDDVIYEKTTITGTATIKPKKREAEEWQ